MEICWALRPLSANTAAIQPHFRRNQLGNIYVVQIPDTSARQLESCFAGDSDVKRLLSEEVEVILFVGSMK